MVGEEGADEGGCIRSRSIRMAFLDVNANDQTLSPP